MCPFDAPDKGTPDTVDQSGQVGHGACPIRLGGNNADASVGDTTISTPSLEQNTTEITVKALQQRLPDRTE